MSEGPVVAVRAEVRLDLAPTEIGGLQVPMPNGNRGALYCFLAPVPGEHPVILGAVVQAEGVTSLRPGGQDVRAELTFWADLASIHVTPGAGFWVWYERLVGRGVVVRTVDPAGEDD